MKCVYLGALTLALAFPAGRASAASVVTGDYVESRSANIFVGACHHEGELLTVGRNALLAWNVTGGDYQGVALTGMRAVAVVAADRNLELADAKRKSVLYVSASASPAQRDAFVALLRERAPGVLGEIAAVKVAPVSFDATGDVYRVQAAGSAFAKIRKQTQELCCKQPYELWSKPFVNVKSAKAGYCIGTEYKDSTLLQAWSTTEQNNAYFGQFAL